MENLPLTHPYFTRNVEGVNATGRFSYPEPSPFVLDEAGPGLLLEYWYLLRSHKNALLVAACAGLLLSSLFTLAQAPVYQVHTTLEIQNRNENFLNMREVSPTVREESANPLETDLQTQVNILQSESVLRQVIAQLELPKKLLAEKDKERLTAWRKALRLPEPETTLTEDEVLPLVSRSLKVRMEPNTRLVEVLYDSTNPQLAAQVANALTAEFIRQNLESRWQTSQKTGEWLTSQMEDVRIKLEKSEAELQNYARRAGLIMTSEKGNVNEEKLLQLQEELSRAHADRVARQSKYEQAGTAPPGSLPEVLDDPTLKDYQVKLTDLRRQLAELSSSLTPAHPSVKKVQAQVSALETELEKERANVTGRVQNEFEAARRREKLLAASYEAQAEVMADQWTKVAHYNILKREVDNNRQMYDSMLQHVREAGIASTLHASNVRVVDPARPPLKPYKPSPILNGMLGLLSGVFFGVIFVAGRAHADRSIQAPGEASLYLDVPELGVIPSANAALSRYFSGYHNASSTEDGQPEDTKRPNSVELVTWERKPSLLADSFRSVLASILYVGQNSSQLGVITVTSASPREGKTTVASNLGLALAEIGRRVLLIDGDLRKPRLHEIFDVSNDWGFRDILEGKNPPEGPYAMVIGTTYGSLHVLPAGSAPASISNLLHSSRGPDFLKRMRQEFDMVILDTPPMLEMPDARILGRMADAVILVVRSARTTKEKAAAAGKRLAEDGTRVLGTVLNEWDPRKASHSGYEYGHGRYYHH